jgi:two-component system, cell cycle sensor histidine kinase and response regulator CckA
MNKDHDQSADAAELRRRAEERLSKKRKIQRSEAGNRSTADDTARLIHELQVHEIELEMQNEELRKARAQGETLLAQYTDLYDFAPAGYLILDREGGIRQVNLTAAQLLGVERSQLVNRRFGLFVTESDRRTFGDFLQKVFAGQAKEGCEVTLRRENSQPVVVRISGLRSVDGQECRAVAVDITEHKRQEKALCESETQLRVILESTTDGIMAVDSSGEKVIKANRRFGDLWQIPQSLIDAGDNRALRNFVLKQLSDPDAFLKKTLSLYGTDAVAIDVLTFKDGRIFERYGFPMLTDGVVAGRVWSYRDITERKQAEEELARTAMEWQTTFNATRDAIWILDRNHRILRTNKPAENCFQRPCSEMMGKPCWEILHGTTEPIPECPYVRARKSGHRETTDLQRGERWFEVIVDPIFDAAGQFAGAVHIVSDITQHRTLEAQFRQVQKMEGIGQLAAGVAHDFNNILAVIQLHASLLKTEEDVSSEQLESANEIEKAAERAANLTRQLLMFSRRQTMQPHDLDLNQSINDMTKMLRRTIGENIQVQFKFAMQPLFIHADAGMLDQVLMNLAVNAHDAMPQGGQLVIEASAVEFDESVRAHSPLARPGSFVCLSVSDTGCGIPPENLLRIFEPFFTTKDVGKGTGLGLATVFGIVQQHQGWINVYSEVSRGTTFRVYLPRLAARSGHESVQAELTAVRGGSETVLLVEDEVALRASMCKALSQLGYRVLESVSGVEAQKVWEQHRKEIDLLLTDMVMPGGMSGKDLAEKLLHENPKLKVIYTSGYSIEVASRDFPLEEGVNFLAKPFGAHKLAQTVRDRLDQKQRRA